MAAAPGRSGLISAEPVHWKEHGGDEAGRRRHPPFLARSRPREKGKRLPTHVLENGRGRWRRREKHCRGRAWGGALLPRTCHRTRHAANSAGGQSAGFVNTHMHGRSLWTGSSCPLSSGDHTKCLPISLSPEYTSWQVRTGHTHGNHGRSESYHCGSGCFL